MVINRISRLLGYVRLTAKLPNGSPASIDTVAVAVIPLGSTPTKDTVWTEADYADGEITVLFAGPDADPTGAVVVDGSRDLWARVIDTPEVIPAKVGRIIVR